MYSNAPRRAGSPLASAPPAPVGAAPAALDVYVEKMVAADEALAGSLAATNAAIGAWEAGSGASVVDLSPIRALKAAVDEVSFLDIWVGRVAEAFRSVDRWCAPPACDDLVRAADPLLDRAGPATLADARASLSASLAVVEHRAENGTRVLRLDIESLPAPMSALEWRLVSEALDIGVGPLHLVIHGWGASARHADRAGSAVADIYDRGGVEGATVVVVDWDAGRGAGGVDTVADFGRAERSAARSGATLADFMDGVGMAHPGAEVAVTAHSLGNALALEAIDGLRRDTDIEIDLLMLQPAVPTAAAGDVHRLGRTLVDPRLAHLTVTVNPRDVALFFYELRGGQALGDEPAGSASLESLRERRASIGLGTVVVSHDSPGGGHLDIVAGANQPLVERLIRAGVSRRRPFPTVPGEPR